MTDGPSGLERLEQAGLAPGFLARLPRPAAERLASDGVAVDLPAGAVVYRGDDPPRAFVVVRGMLRLYVSSPDGRQATIRYGRSGDVLGLPMVLGGPAPVTIEARTDAYVLALSTDTLRALVERDHEVARVCAEELSGIAFTAFDGVADQAFLGVRQRVERHLLEIATPGQDGRLVARATQQELADAVGSVREVVARTLAQLREEGLVETSRDLVVLRDVDRLVAEANAESPGQR